MKVQLLAAASAGALTLFFAGAALANMPPPPSGNPSDPITVNAAVSLGLGNQSAQGNSVSGSGSAGGALTNKDNLTISGGSGNVGGDNTNVNKSNSGQQVSTGGTVNTGNNASKGSAINTGTLATDGGTNNSGAYASKGGTNNSGSQASDGGVNNSGAYASKGGTVNSGTQVSDGGVQNTGNYATKGGQIQTGANDVGGDYTVNSGSRSWSLYKVSTDTTLQATVTGNKVGAQNWTGSATTGGITPTEAGFAGIQTAANNTGLNSANQTATAVAANANISFGSVGNVTH